MADHWWWRPGWRVGRSFWTWHVTFAAQPGVQALVDAYAPCFDGLGGLDPVPVEWLHLTMQGLGFTDEVEHTDVDAIVLAARRRFAEVAPFAVTVGPAGLDPETVHLPVRPAEPLIETRSVLRSAINDVWDHVPERADGWRPHVTLAYSNVSGPAEPIADRLAAHGAHIAEVTVSALSLIELNRDHRQYEWTDVATVGLTGSRSDMATE
ncbi:MULTISPECIES: 2'-5' RNA ligase family protein [Actinoalloteichus]|nr:MULTISPECIES: 2'-5' RNA ligase family protein [Actinoalloteichus]